MYDTSSTNRNRARKSWRSAENKEDWTRLKNDKLVGQAPTGGHDLAVSDGGGQDNMIRVGKDEG